MGDDLLHGCDPDPSFRRLLEADCTAAVTRSVRQLRPGTARDIFSLRGFLRRRDGRVLRGRYRRCYPDATVDAVADLLRLNSGDVVIDLGCGTGLLTQALARRVRIVLGVDPEADMLAVARRSADEELNPKLVWVLGSDADLLTIGRLIGA